MGQLTQTTSQLQTILDNTDASNAGKTSLSDASDTTAVSLKKSGFYSLAASSSNAPSTDRSVLMTAVRDTGATGEIRYGQVVWTESNGLWWNRDDGGSLGTWYEAVATAATQTLTNKTLTSPVLTTPQINDTSSDHQYIFAASELVADRTVTLPLLTGNDTFVFEAHTQTLTNKTLTSAVLNTGVSGSAVLDSDTMSGASATTLATSESIKAYVDSQVTAQDLDFAGGTGTGAVDLDSQTFTIAGTTNEIETSASGQTLTVGLPSAVSITTSLNIGSSTTVDGVLDEDNMASNSATKLATQQSIKAYVDAQVATADTLAEVLANGNTSGGTGLTMSSGDDLTLTGASYNVVWDSSDSALEFADNAKAIFGAGSDLQIYHDGSHSRLVDSGTGNFIIQAGEFRVNTSDDGEAMIKGNENGDVELYFNGAEKLATTSTGIDVTGVITTDGMTTSADVNFGDNDKAVFGAGSDLQIYHSGAASYISDTGDGSLLLTGNGGDISFYDAANSAYMVRANTGGDVQISHAGTVRLATTSTGADITGTLTADAAEVSKAQITTNFDTSAFLRLHPSATTNSGGLTNVFFGTSTNDNYGISIGGERAGTDASPDFVIRTHDNSATGVQRLRIEDNGDFSLYEDTGTTAKLFWDSSAESLGIGTSSPASAIELEGVGNATNLTLDNTTASTGRSYSIRSGNTGNLDFYDNDATNARVTIDSSGNLLVGKTTTAFATQGVTVNNNGSAEVTKDGGATLFLNRLNSDGSIISVYKDGTTVGSIGAFGGDLYIGTNDSGLRFEYAGLNAIVPFDVNSSAVSDAATDLGNGSARFKDLHLSGAVKVGSNENVEWSAYSAGTSGVLWTGNGTSNTLDAYTTGSLRMRIDSSGTLVLSGNGGSTTNSLDIAYNGTSGQASINADSGSGSTYLTFSTSSSGSLSEAARIDSSGNLLVNRTAVFTTAKAEIQSDSGDASTLALNSIDTNGSMLEFYKAGTSVGSIGVDSSIYLKIDTSYSGLFFDNGKLLPTANGSLSDGGQDLGRSATRFKDLYLSGRAYINDGIKLDSGDGIYFGQDGTAANKLDDYEEGSWTPTFNSASFTASGVTSASGAYVKIGDFVQVSFVFTFSGTSGNFAEGDAASIGGLPFNPVTFSGAGTANASQDYLNNVRMTWQTLPIDGTDDMYMIIHSGAGTVARGSTGISGVAMYSV